MWDNPPRRWLYAGRHTWWRVLWHGGDRRYSRGCKIIKRCGGAGFHRCHSSPHSWRRRYICEECMIFNFAVIEIMIHRWVKRVGIRYVAYLRGGICIIWNVRSIYVLVRIMKRGGGAHTLTRHNSDYQHDNGGDEQFMDNHCSIGVKEWSGMEGKVFSMEREKYTTLYIIRGT